MVENQPDSSGQHSSQDQPISGGIPEHIEPDPPSTKSDTSHDSKDEVDQQLLAHLAQKGGVKFLDLLLAKAISPLDLESSDTSKTHEWTYKDILKMPSDKQEEWCKVCCEESESLHKCKVFKPVDLPKGRKVIKNQWVFNLK
jgi:hypothetical protein